METATMSPTVLTEITGNSNSDSLSTPEQDPGVLDNVVKAILLAPKSKRIASWLPQHVLEHPAPIVKSKVDVKDDDFKEDGKYLILQGNPSSNVAKHALKIKKITTKKCPPAPAVAAAAASLCPRAEKILQKVEEGSFPKKTQPQAHPNRSHLNQCGKIPSRTESVTNSLHPPSGPPKEKMTPSPPPQPPPPAPPQKVVKKVTTTKLPIPQKPPEKGKHYDPVQVKSFMEMQREVRRMKERKELEERRQEAERKKKHLLDLDHKRKDLISKSRHSPKKIESKDDQVSLATKNYRARKAKSPSAARIVHPPSTHDTQPIVMTRSPTKRKEGPAARSLSNDHREGMSEKRAAADAEFRTTMLLQEFENIVHRECLKLTSNQFKSYRVEKSCSTTATTTDVGVETTTSLYENEQNGPANAPSTSRSLEQFRRSRADQWEGRVHETDQLRELQEAAALKIQSAFRGYKIRKIWREVSEANFRRPARRISFYQPRRHPMTVESVRRRLPLLSPSIHSPSRTSSPLNLRPTSSGGRERSAFGMPLDFAPYIPPPPRSAGQLNPSSAELKDFPTYPVSVPSRASLERRRSNRFDEPFPKEAIKQLARQSPALGISPALSDHMMSFRDVSSPVTVNTAFIPGISELLHVPTFSMVLKEKVRLIQEMHQSSARKSGVPDDRTPVKRRPQAPAQAPNPPSDTTYYDSDSTQHASIAMSGAKYDSAASSTDVTITDDYIGPDEEAMQLAYNLRRSARVSLENVENLPRDDESEMTDNSTIPSYVTFDTTAGTDDRRNFNEETKGTVEVKDSLENFKRVVDEKNREVIAHAAQVSNQLKRDKIKEIRLRGAADTSPDRAIEKKVDELHHQVTAMDANVRSTLAKLSTTEVAAPVPVPPPAQPRVDNADFLLEFAKCQTESLKATAQIQQLVADLRRSSQLEVQESRHQETVNIAAAVYAAVEEAKKLAQPATAQPQRHLVQAQGVQTTDSLLQNESLPNYSSDRFLDTSDESQLKEEEILDKSKVAQRLEKEPGEVRRTIFDDVPHTSNFQQAPEKSVSGGSDLSITLDSIQSVNSSTSLTRLPPQLPPPPKAEKRVMVTFADVLREVKLLTPLRTETKQDDHHEAHHEVISSRESSISSTQEVSNERLPVSLESKEVSKKSNNVEPFSDEEFEQPSTASGESRSHSVVPGKLPLEEPSRVEKSLDESLAVVETSLEEVASVEESKAAESIASERLEEVASIVESVDASSPPRSKTPSESPVEKDTLDQTIEESGHISPTTKSLSSILEQPTTASNQSVKEAASPLDVAAGEPSQDTQESEKPVTSLDFESVKSTSASPSVHEVLAENLKQVAVPEISAAASAENDDEKNTLDVSIAESEGEELSYQSDFISNEASSLSPTFHDHLLTVDQLDLDEDEAAEGEASGNEEEEASVAGGESKVSGSEVPEPASESRKSSIEHEKNTLDESIASEPLEEDEQLSFISEASASTLPKTPLPEASTATVDSTAEAEVLQENLEKSSVDEALSAVEAVSSPSDLLTVDDAKIHATEEIEESERHEPYEIEPQGEVGTEAATTIAPLDVSPTEDMLLDMMELSDYREENGFPVRKPCRKWCVRERDIVDHVLVGDTLDENRSWTDYRSEIAEVTENLVESIARRAVHHTMTSIAKVMKH